MCAAASLSIARYFEVMQAFRELRVAHWCMQAHRGASTQSGVSYMALNACRGDNRSIYEGMIGYWYRLYRGDFGWIAYGNQITYMHRSLWSGIGDTPDGRNVVVYSTLRFYLP